ncbi:MAG: PAS domain S-box protein [Proteobacteria bacterium]|nr:PAS domain S-box protein [Pseudomonadota bacterium]
MDNRLLITIIDFLPDATFAINRNGNVTAWNKAIEEMTGIKREDMLGKGDYAYAIPFYSKKRPLLIDFVLQSTKAAEDSYSYIEQHGSTIYAEAYVPGIKKGTGGYLWGTAAPLLDDNGNIHGAIESLRDITDRKVTELKLKESEEKFRLLFEKSSDPAILLDGDKIIDCNEATLRLMHCPAKEQLIGFHPFDISPERQPDGRLSSEKVRELIDAVFRAGAIDFEWVHRTFEGEDLWIDVSLTLIPIQGKQIVFMVWRNITEQKRAEEGLEKEKYKFLTLIENAPFGMALVDKKGYYTFINAKFREMFGYDLHDIPNGREWCRKAYPDPEYRHKVIETWFEDIEKATYDPSLKETGKWTFTVTCKDSTKKVVNFISVRLPTGEYLMTYKDITELKRLEAQLLHSQKMEAVGTLAGGVAHDFNNILTAIIGFTTFTKRKLSYNDPVQHYLDNVLSAAERAANLTQSLLAFSRKQTISPKNIDIDDVIRKFEKLLIRLIGEGIEFNFKYSGESLIVKADQIQLERILMNLVINARDAMPKGGSLSIHTCIATINERFVEGHGYGKPGEYAFINVSDSGTGIDEITKKKIFEPFFTTKEVGKGTGLGLSIVYGLVKQHNGYIECESQPGHGTTFKIYFPLLQSDVKIKTIKTKLTHHRQKPMTGQSQLHALHNQ